MTQDGIELQYKATLHLNHPELNPDTVTAALGLRPSFQHRKGEPKLTPNGTIRPGVNSCNHWSHRFDLTGVRDLFGYLDERFRRWESPREFFNQVSESGGESLLFCGIIAARNWDEQIPYQMSGRLASLKIDLRLDAWAKTGPLPIVRASEKPLGE